MRSVDVLDCTLRDGGYCNQWNFGHDNIHRILSDLPASGIDIVECGFISEKINENSDISKYKRISEAEHFLPSNRGRSLFVGMINYGEYDFSSIPARKMNGLDGIRVAFHKRNMLQGLEACKSVKDAGYLVFVQAMVTLTYSDEEFLDLIKRVNELEPYAFYIVDSFGNMRAKDLLRYYSLLEHNLKENIKIGFHSHNNLQLAYSNAKMLVEQPGDRSLIIDSSIYGMGRGAGNLNTELFVEYLNGSFGVKYDIVPLLGIMDDIINGFYRENPWGYSLSNYLSAVHNAHPNYAGYYSDLNTLTFRDMDQLFLMMDPERKLEYNKDYAKEMYLRYMETGESSKKHLTEMESVFKDKDVILVAPGKSSDSEKNVILRAKDESNLLISVNFDYSYVIPDYIFVSNLRRFQSVPVGSWEKCIVTSNIPSDNVFARTDYKDLLNGYDSVKDNAGLMAVRFLLNMGCRKILLAGFDGYSHDQDSNYADQRMEIVMKNALMDDRNEGMGQVLSDYSREGDIRFLTSPVHIRMK